MADIEKLKQEIIDNLDSKIKDMNICANRESSKIDEFLVKCDSEEYKTTMADMKSKLKSIQEENNQKLLTFKKKIEEYSKSDVEVKSDEQYQIPNFYLVNEVCQNILKLTVPCLTYINYIPATNSEIPGKLFTVEEFVVTETFDVRRADFYEDLEDIPIKQCDWVADLKFRGSNFYHKEATLGVYLWYKTDHEKDTQKCFQGFSATFKFINRDEEKSVCKVYSNSTSAIGGVVWGFFDAIKWTDASKIHRGFVDKNGCIQIEFTVRKFYE